MRTTVIAAIVSSTLVVAGLLLFDAKGVLGVIYPFTSYDADVNKDGKVNSTDLLAVAKAQRTPVPTMTPTPSSYCNLSGCNLIAFQAENNHGQFIDPVGLMATFDDCDFSGANLYGAAFGHSSLRRAHFKNARLDAAHLTGADFSNADLTGATFHNLQPSAGANFSNANLTNVALDMGFPGGFYGTDFTGATTTGMTLGVVLWNNTTCPDATNSDNDGGSCIGHGFAGVPLATYTPTPTSTPTDTPTATATPTDTPTATATPIPCAGAAANAIWTLGNGHCYQRFDTPNTFAGARADCESRGDHLVTLANQAEQDFVWTNVGQVSTFIGFTDEVTEGVFQWVTDEPIQYTNWDVGEPNDGLGGGTEDAVVFAAQHPNGSWNDAPVTVNLPYICESQ